MTGVPRTTFSILIIFFALLILSGFRLWLYSKRRAELRGLSRVERIRLFWTGFRLDSVIVSRGCLILVMLALLIPEWMVPLSRPYLLVYVGIFYFVLFLAEIAGYYFFRYYDFRPNYLVFEHGADREVLKTIVRGYPVLRIVLLSAVGMCATIWVIGSTDFIEAKVEISELPWFWDRWGTFIFLLLTGFATRGTLDHRPLNPSLSSVSSNRIANEIAGCGLFNVMYEWRQHFKKKFTALKSIVKLPSPNEAVRRCRSRLSAHGRFTDDSPNPLVRLTRGATKNTPLNVVLVVMESFTGRLTGCIGGDPAISPEFDKIAAEGVLFEKCYATGERTIQALEGAVCSFPPLPGEGVVKRPQARQGFASLAEVLKERGYSTLFLYGGQGIFDQMRAFFVANGFDRFIEEKDFTDPEYRSAWGVSDEDLFRRADQEFRALHAQGRPFFATLLTVSLHSPWDYPSGRIDPLPASTAVPAGFSLEELNNFRYADYAIGKFIRDARGAEYFDNTLFVFVGDHGVHLGGRDLVPIDEFRVPALFLAPPHLQAKRIHEVASQIDLPPTIMGIVGGDYRNPFFGNDALKVKLDGNFATVIYNKKRYGVVSARELIVLTETGEQLAYQKADSGGVWRQVPLTGELSERSKDAVATLRVGEDLLVSGRYTARPT
jgi:phosphoglycerol transferase MdoB-like AlkP superfamily enzyme